MLFGVQVESSQALVNYLTIAISQPVKHRLQVLSIALDCDLAAMKLLVEFLDCPQGVMDGMSHSFLPFFSVRSISSPLTMSRRIASALLGKSS